MSENFTYVCQFKNLEILHALENWFLLVVINHLITLGSRINDLIIQLYYIYNL